MFASIFLLFLPISIVAQSTPTVLCFPGQCLQGYSNTTIGISLLSSSISSHIQLLPGAYSVTTNPQLLHNALTSSSTITSSPGFTNSTPVSLPLDLALEPGLSIYSGSLYSGQGAFTGLPSSPIVNSSTSLPAKSLALSTNTWIAVNAGSSNRIIVWEPIPDVEQLPSNNQGSLSLTDIQSSACSPSCTGSGLCTSAGTCMCPQGFTGSSCESCATGFFGPTCRPCPTNCQKCDDGINGSGRCLLPAVGNAPSTCNCKNGVCSSNGQCTCNTGFATGNDGIACSTCAPGFFLTSTGDCQVCQLGCTQCADGNGACTTCQSGFSKDGNDPTKCNPPKSTTTTGQLCPDGSFANGANCSVCSSTCQTCTGGTSNDCIVCASGLFKLNGQCVSADSNGICQGTNLIADNNKHECDSCGASCLKCQISNFNVASTVDQKKCTQCLPGFFLSNGTCVQSCPAGTTLSSQDNVTCIPCDSSCTTCSGTSTFCLACANNQLASGGKCVSSCPSGTFSSSGQCLPCHPDCASCLGGSFNQCTSCSSDLPVLTNGRCLPTCTQSQFFDRTSSSCQSCDPSCSSCSGSGPSNCLACSSSTQVLRGGSCVSANCQSDTSVVPGLGVCLSDLVVTAPSSTGTGTSAPLPTITGLNEPTTIVKSRRLQWWEILLMALGCAFIFLVFIWLFRRRQRKQRAKKTALFATGAAVNRGPTSWRWRLIRFGEKLFGQKHSYKAPHIVHLGPVQDENEDIKLSKLRAAEEARMLPPPRSPPRPAPPSQADIDMVNLIGSYNRPDSPEGVKYYPQQYHNTPRDSISDASSSRSAPSLYSQMTGMPRRGPDPRQPVRKDLTARFSANTLGIGERERRQQQSQPAKNPFWK
ncbi:TNFR/NGFR cysteine-rich region family protein [Gymnopilus junonius]|uniref:TNFR/NGFR cysteine-rich region family protein n=1 Tax=Gymnopilus junonius TaxID=109634 RepID=A0A9P5TJD8_GYMJU|nr:TNFR/NGFR cysteine-rich region family protein [Gymnopilus junonius]